MLAGHKRFGQIVLGIWIAMILGVVAYAGSSASWLWYVVAVGFHCFIVTLLMSRLLQRLPIARRLATGLLIYAALNCLLYLPANWVVHRFIVPVQLNGLRRIELLNNGDTVLHSGPWAHPEAWNCGDLVFYRIHGLNMNNVIIGDGYGVDRIVARGDDLVEVKDGKLLINGQGVTGNRMPVNGLVGIPNGWKIQVPPRHYLVFPSTLRLGGQGANYEHYVAQALHRIAVLGEGDVMGRVWWRLRPWKQFGPLE